MRGLFVAVLLVGVGLAGFAVHMAQGYIEDYQVALEKERSTRKPEVETVDVFVATKKMKYGEELSPDSVFAMQWPKHAVPEGIFKTKEELFPNDNAEPRFVLRVIEPGDPLMAVKITKPGEDAGVINRIAKGMRAFALRVDVASGVSGFLRPGDRVDVYWTGSTERNGDEDSRNFTKLIQSNVHLIAIDQNANIEGVKGTIARTVTVAVKPNEVAALAQAQNSGRLSLALVGAQDDTVAEVIEVDQSKLLGIERKERVAEIKKEEKVCTIRTRRGAEVVSIAIPCSN